MDLDLSITNGMTSSKVYDKQDNFNFEIIHVISNFLMEMSLVPLSVQYIFRSLFVLREYNLISNALDFFNATSDWVTSKICDILSCNTLPEIV